MEKNDYTVEFCPNCNQDVAIHATGITACPECGEPLAPCSVCWDMYGGCLRTSENPSACPYGCTGGPEDSEKTVTNPPMTAEEIAFAFKNW